MFHNANEFLDHYQWESDCTARVLEALTDESLSTAKADGHNSLGDIAWHVATAPAFMMKQTDYEMPEFGFQTPDGLTAAKVLETYKDNCAKVKDQSATRTPEDLQKVYHVFGTMDWPLSAMMNALVAHEIHHRGQISVLMRQAGLTVPSIYGPNAEDTAEMMAKQQQG